MAKKRKKQDAEEALEQEDPLAEETPEQDGASGGKDDLAVRRAELLARQRQYEEKLRALEVAEVLRERGLPADLAPYLAPPEGEDLQTWADGFEMLFRSALAEAVALRLRGLGAPREPAKAHGYSRGELKGLSAGEINAHWDEIAQALRE